MNLDPDTMTLADAESALQSPDLPPDLRLTAEQCAYLGPALLRQEAVRRWELARDRGVRRRRIELDAAP